MGGTAFPYIINSEQPRNTDTMNIHIYIYTYYLQNSTQIWQCLIVVSSHVSLVKISYNHFRGSTGSSFQISNLSRLLGKLESRSNDQEWTSNIAFSVQSLSGHQIRSKMNTWKTKRKSCI